MKTNKKYVGESGNLYQVSFIPYYMMNWSKDKQEIYLQVVNKLPKKLLKKFEDFLAKESGIEWPESKYAFTKNSFDIDKEYKLRVGMDWGKDGSAHTVIFGDNAFGVSRKT